MSDTVHSYHYFKRHIVSFVSRWYTGEGYAVGQLVETIRLKSRTSRFRFLVVSLEFFIDGSAMVLGSTQPLTEMSTVKISCGVKAAGAQG